VGQGILSQIGWAAREGLGSQARRTALISNRKIYSLYGHKVEASLKANGFSVSHWLMGDGERFKSLRTAEQALRFLHGANLDRGDGVVALGGGVVGDVAGFASAIYLRGIPIIQIPTTLLAQIDASVGGKTGVNMPGGKNLIGSFHQPRAVVIDIETLKTLPQRELTAGWCEAVKQGAVGSRDLFKTTVAFLRNLHTTQLQVSSSLAKLIAAQVSFKATLVKGDDREDISREDARSRKILNFGHTVAHALETLTNYRRFRHGEAVGQGMLAAGALSKNLGLLKQSELELLTEGVRMCGPLPSASDLDASAIINAIHHDKKRSGGSLQWVLLERIGRPRIVRENQIDARMVRRSLREALK
jgi:3-dehydroquinate synthase